MQTNVTVPALGESITDAIIAKWNFSEGDAVKSDDVLLELETDKVSVEVSAPHDGILSIAAEKGATVNVGDKVGVIDDVLPVPAPMAAPAPIEEAIAQASHETSKSNEETINGLVKELIDEPENVSANLDAVKAINGTGNETKIDITIPSLGESVTEAIISKWNVEDGAQVARDEVLLELETDKVSVEVSAPNAGIITMNNKVGDTIAVGQIVGTITCRDGSAPSQAKATPKDAPDAPAQPATPSLADAIKTQLDSFDEIKAGPATRQEMRALGITDIEGTGIHGNVTPDDILNATAGQTQAQSAPATPAPAPEMAIPAPAPTATAPEAPPAVAPETQTAALPQAPTSQAVMIPEQAPATATRDVDLRGEERVRMSKLRQSIATRLKQAQNNAAMLTTFNEVNMTALIGLRKEYRDTFEKKYNIRLGFMSFFAKAAVVALKEVPSVNAEVDGDEIIYKNYYDIGIAVGSANGLVVPVLRDVDRGQFFRY